MLAWAGNLKFGCIRILYMLMQLWHAKPKLVNFDGGAGGRMAVR